MSKVTSASVNAKKILNYIKYDGINTRTAIAQKLSVTKGLVTGLVGELLSNGVLVETKTMPNRQAKGRSAVVLDINDSYKLSVGVVVENNVISTAICTMNGNVVAHKQIKIMPSSYHDVLSIIVKEITAIISDNLILPDKILGVGICVGDDIIAMTEGTNKLRRIKKDLSHALNLHLTVNLTANGLLIASKVFSTNPILTGCAAVIRYGRAIGSAYMVNCEIPPYTASFIDGFKQLQEADISLSYSLFKAADEATKSELIKSLCSNINTYITILSLKKLYLVGDFFEQYYNEALTILDKKYKHKQCLELLSITERTIGVSGCAIAADTFFSQYDTLS